MRVFAGCVCAVSLAAPSVAAIAPPPRPGPWTQVGRTQASAVGKPLHFFRTALDPKSLGVVVESSKPQRFKLLWATDCEVLDDDIAEEQHQGTVTGVKRLVVYPPVLDAATRCYVWVNVTSPGQAVVRAAVFSSVR